MDRREQCMRTVKISLSLGLRHKAREAIAPYGLITASTAVEQHRVV